MVSFNVSACFASLFYQGGGVCIRRNASNSALFNVLPFCKVTSTLILASWVVRKEFTYQKSQTLFELLLHNIDRRFTSTKEGLLLLKCLVLHSRRGVSISFENSPCCVRSFAPFRAFRCRPPRPASCRSTKPEKALSPASFCSLFRPPRLSRLQLVLSTFSWS